MNSYGKLLRPRVITHAASTQRPADNLVNDSGMSGSGGMTHTVGDDLQGMWLTVRDPADPSLVFDFGVSVRLGYMAVWNFNQSDGFLSGLKKVKIELSCDGEHYNELRGKGYPYEFACASGKAGQKATNLANGEPVDFAGATCRFVRITPQGGMGEGCHGPYLEGQLRYGLSQVRFFRYRAEPKGGAYAYAEALQPEANITTTEAGLSKGRHGTDPKTMYLSPVLGCEMSLTYDMHMAATLDGVHLYNYNDPKNLGAGLKQFLLEGSLDGHSWQVLTRGELARGTGRPDYEGQTVAFSVRYVRFLRLTALGGTGQGTWGSCNGFEFRMGLGKFLPRFAPHGYYFENARDWTALLSNYDGWGGADGIFAAPLNGNERVPEGKQRDDFRTLLLFSDTFVGKSDPVTKSRRHAGFVNNSLGYMTGLDPQTLQLELVYGQNESRTETPILRCESNEYYYWMQDCAVINDTFYVFTDNVVADNSPELPEGFKFRLVGVDMVSFPIEKGRLCYAKQTIRHTPLFADERLPVYFGCGVLVNTKQNGMEGGDGYVYVYGMRTRPDTGKDLLVARVLPQDITNFEAYTFFDGKSFVKGMHNAAAICDELSSEMSVMPIDDGPDKGKYLYTYSGGGVGDRMLCRLGETPYGPFSQAHEVFYIGDTEDLDTSKIERVYRYNGKAHYHLAAVGEVLMTHNVNTMDYESHLISADVYRPRFIRGKRY